MLYSVSGLCLQTNQLLAGLVPRTTPYPVDVRIRLGRTLPGVHGPLATNELWHASSDLDDRGRPLLAIWSLAEGMYFRMAYGEGGEFLFDRHGTRIWGVWSSSIK